MGRKNNKFWELRKTHGRNKAFDGPEELWQQACLYFEWAYQNPWKEEKVFSTGARMKANHPRPFTLKALCFHLNITAQSWSNYQKRAEFAEVTESIESVIWTQKFEGAAVGMFNPAIIARELGLKDATDITTNGQAINRSYWDHLKLKRTKAEVDPNLNDNPDEKRNGESQ